MLMLNQATQERDCSYILLHITLNPRRTEMFVEVTGEYTWEKGQGEGKGEGRWEEYNIYNSWMLLQHLH